MRRLADALNELGAHVLSPDGELGDVAALTEPPAPSD
jgi:hypothetical protein